LLPLPLPAAWSFSVPLPLPVLLWCAGSLLPAVCRLLRSPSVSLPLLSLCPLLALGRLFLPFLALFCLCFLRLAFSRPAFLSWSDPQFHCFASF
jgi:hypothetical protein